MRSKSRKIIFSFFAGAGFLDLGFENSVFEIAFVNEVNASFLEAYKSSRKKMELSAPRYGFYKGNMANLTRGLWKNKLRNYVTEARKENSIVGFIGGPPCPDFSIAGKNRGRKGRLGKLSETYTVLIKQQKPDFFLFENVKGLWKTKYHRQFYEELKKDFQENGYIVTEKLINAIEYGAAQDRDRIILIGFKKDLIPEAYLDSKNRRVIKDGIFPWSKFIKYKKDEVFEHYRNVKYQYFTPMDEKPGNIPIDTTVQYWFDKNKVLLHPNAQHCFQPRQALPRFKIIKEGDVSKKSFKRLHRWRYSPTAAYGNNEVHLHPYEARRISVAEALAIQSLPKEFTLPDTMTLSDMFKVISNGVPYVAAKGVAKSINKFLDIL